MTLDSLNSLVALLLAISLASERLVTIVKTAVPWLDEPARAPTGKEDPRKDKVRRLIVQALAFAGAGITGTLLAAGDQPLSWSLVFSGTITYADHQSLPVLLVAFLGSGGSALWSQLLGYTRAVRELRQQDVRAGASGRSVRAGAAAAQAGTQGNG